MDSFGQVGMDLDGAEAVAGDGARARKRDSLFLSARMTVGDLPDLHDVRVRNLSAGGLMADFDRAVEVGTAVTLEMRGLGALTGRVAWCTQGRLGIAFDAPIDPTRARKPVGTGASTPAFARPLVVPTRRR